MSQDYDFSALYGMADKSAGVLYPEAWYDAVVESAEYGRTKDGSKGQWTVKVRTTTGEGAGARAVPAYLTISPVNDKNEPNSMGLGILFRQLAALGVPVPDPDPAHAGQVLNGQAPFWVMRWTYEQVAQAMVGRPVYVKIIQNEFDGGTNNKVRDIRPPRPGAPTSWPQNQPQQQPQGQPGFQQGQPWQQPQAQPQYGAQGYTTTPGAAPQGWQTPQPQYGQGGGGGEAWQQPQQPPAQQPPQQQIPGAPPWAQPPNPGQPGTGQFTQQGQAGGPPPVPQPPWQQQQQPPQQQYGQPPANGQPPAPQAQQGGPGEAQPGQAPWMQ